MKRIITLLFMMLGMCQVGLTQLPENIKILEIESKDFVPKIPMVEVSPPVIWNQIIYSIIERVTGVWQYASKSNWGCRRSSTFYSVDGVKVHFLPKSISNEKDIFLRGIPAESEFKNSNLCFFVNDPLTIYSLNEPYGREKTK